MSNGNNNLTPKNPEPVLLLRAFSDQMSEAINFLTGTNTTTSNTVADVWVTIWHFVQLNKFTISSFWLSAHLPVKPSNPSHSLLLGVLFDQMSIRSFLAVTNTETLLLCNGHCQRCKFVISNQWQRALCTSANTVCPLLVNIPSLTYTKQYLYSSPQT